eukprot:TRINITY_DN14992_c0_g1_i1.p1 TRINITY_DN14992_c0_g1~~TRINITY_DN14992_c0_g1_i1.p1  ORF type:complete len:1005 (+),score=375.55 TRINITY_DN14992_c0_g1_i1:74-3016(+)
MDSVFLSKLNGALGDMRKVLEVWRQPELPENVDHQYGDKYRLAESVVNAAVLSTGRTLGTLGLTLDAALKAKEWSEEQTVTLSLRRSETCDFDKKETRDEESATKHVTEVKGVFGTSKATHKVVTTITDYHWNFGYSYKILLYAGTDADGAIEVAAGEGSTRITTRTDSSPHPKVHVPDHVEHDLTWFLKQAEFAAGEGGLGLAVTPQFAIDRDHAKCRTPSRNPGVNASVAHACSLVRFCRTASSYFLVTIFPRQQSHPFDLSMLQRGVFTPVLPVMENQALGAPLAQIEAAPSAPPAEGAAPEAAGRLLPANDMAALHDEEAKQLQALLATVGHAIPAPKGLVTRREAQRVVILQHISRVGSALADCLQYLEHMVYSQLVRAIGKSVSSDDFAEYMAFHMRNLYRPEYQPTPFSFNVESQEVAKGDPEGSVSILCSDTHLSGGSEVLTMSRKVMSSTDSAVPPMGMRFELSAAAHATMRGSCFVHSYLRSAFSSSRAPPIGDQPVLLREQPCPTPLYYLHARARQFSSFVLLLGRIGGNDLFLPEHAMIIKNKDDLRIPLFLHTIPSPGEFKKAIQSLSPEQIRFSKAYRAMQLESTLFGIATVPIKPQLERLLSLPQGALNKEVRLSEDLMKLFLEFNIPSDVLSYRSDAEAGHADPNASDVGKGGNPQVEQVKASVAAVLAMINAEKQAEVDEMKAKIISPESSESCSSRGCDDALDGMLCARLEEEECCYMARCAEDECLELEAELECCEAEQEEWDDDEDDDGECESIPVACSSPALAAQAAPQPEPTSEKPAPEAPKPEQQQQEDNQQVDPAEQVASRDLTSLPRELDTRFESLGSLSACVRPTTIKYEDSNGPQQWVKRFKRSLISREEVSHLDTDAQKDEKTKAFDLLDALTKSGALPLDGVAVHVVIATTHCFDKTLMDTLVADNINPIEKAELTSLHTASVIHEKPLLALAAPGQAPRLQQHHAGEIAA